VAKQWGLWDPRSVPAKAGDYDYHLEKPDEALLSSTITIRSVRYRVACGVIFCEVCEGCMACSDDQCLAGGEHVWPEGWEELSERMSD
jgi:hypothetical protein